MKKNPHIINMNTRGTLHKKISCTHQTDSGKNEIPNELMPHNIRVLYNRNKSNIITFSQRMVLLDFSSLFSHFPIKIFIPTYYNTKFKGINLRLPLLHKIKERWERLPFRDGGSLSFTLTNSQSDNRTAGGIKMI